MCVARRAGSIHPQGWVPIETPRRLEPRLSLPYRSIHPQGWVPIETACHTSPNAPYTRRSIHPQGWVPIETDICNSVFCKPLNLVAFTPKGGCPLKLPSQYRKATNHISSIHPQGWVPIETSRFRLSESAQSCVAFTPKGGCPLKLGLGLY